MDLGTWLRQQLEQASADQLREMVHATAQALLSADVDRVCGAEYGTVSDDRVNRRNGYRTRDWDTRVGTIELAIPKLRKGSFSPELLEPRRRIDKGLWASDHDRLHHRDLHEGGR
jgi:putative transposase